MQIARLVADLATLQEQHQDLVAKRDALENSYRVSAIDYFGIQEEAAQDNILRARSSPQKGKHLQDIHEAHIEVLSTETEIKEVECELAIAREARSSYKSQHAAATAAALVAKSRLGDKVLMGW